MIQKRLRYEKETTDTIIDESGTVLEQRNHKTLVRQVNDKPHFILVYLEDLSGFLKIDNLTDMKVMACIWELSGIDSGIAYLVKTVKNQIAEKSGLNYRSVEVSIHRLAKIGLIIKQGEGRSAVYLINPKYFWKGSEISRNSTLDVILKYKIGEDQKGNILSLFPDDEKE